MYNVYTNALVATIDVGRPLGAMTIAHDGSRLFVGDNAGSGDRSITRIDPTTRAVGPTWPTLPLTSIPSLEYTRVDGGAVLFSGGGSIFNPDTGVEYDGFADRFGLRYNDAVATSRDGKRLCMLNRGLNPNTLQCYALKYTDVEGDLLSFEKIGETRTGFVRGQLFQGCSAPFIAMTAAHVANNKTVQRYRRRRQSPQSEPLGPAFSVAGR